MIGTTRAGGVFLFAIVMGSAVFSPSSTFADAPGKDPVAGLMVQEGVWAVMSGSSLKSTLEGWARATDWKIVWDNPVDYRIRASATFYGDFEEAVGRLVDAIYQNNPNLSVTMYRGNKVLHVEDMPLTSN